MLYVEKDHAVYFSALIHTQNNNKILPRTQYVGGLHLQWGLHALYVKGRKTRTCQRFQNPELQWYFAYIHVSVSSLFWDHFKV